ncbi:MFS transporter [Ornithinimicrobium sp. LYQ131]|uniref:MFS transporter n=1 Tax=Serinicoccus sp. LYQ92 TaxID=3378798 RepID=UPI00385414FF
MSDRIDVGAAMMTTMVGAQVVAAVPIARFARRVEMSHGRLLRLLVLFRGLMLAGLMLAVLADAGIPLLLGMAALSGLTYGTVAGLLRAVVNGMVEARSLPRMLAILATLNELMFVAGPVLAATLGEVSIGTALGIMALAAALPAVLLPPISTSAHVEHAVSGRGLLPSAKPGFMLWLVAAGVGTAAIVGIEIGSVALAVSYDLPPARALVIVIPLCLASITGGLIISVRGRQPRIRSVVAMLTLTTAGLVLIALAPSLTVAIAGTVLVGLCVAPLATFYSLILDQLLPPSRRVEGFALLRTSQALGIVAVGALLTLTSPSIALGSAAGTILLVILWVAATYLPPQRPGSTDVITT